MLSPPAAYTPSPPSFYASDEVDRNTYEHDTLEFGLQLARKRWIAGYLVLNVRFYRVIPCHGYSQRGSDFIRRLGKILNGVALVILFILYGVCIVTFGHFRIANGAALPRNDCGVYSEAKLPAWGIQDIPSRCNYTFRRMGTGWHELKRSLGAGSLGLDSKGGVADDILQGVLAVWAESHLDCCTPRRQWEGSRVLRHQ
ncbi:hypothetical protein EDD85DRAFT_1027002 [Armillaria nabsnona]|nr:hypothetical protein EDD85DRAFT_1027002 [Armillaria nabsnona]